MKLVVGISGASGAIYGVRLLQELKNAGIEVALILTRPGAEVLEMETSFSSIELEGLVETVHSNKDLSAPPASGSHLFDAMVICPCSLSTLSMIAGGISDSLITRAAAVTIKERRKLILVPRETPLSTIHLRNMLTLSEDGVIILPPAPAFYQGPKSLDDLVDFIVGRILDSLNIRHNLYRRWGN